LSFSLVTFSPLIVSVLSLATMDSSSLPKPETATLIR
jgi:hypothetical protein